MELKRLKEYKNIFIEYYDYSTISDKNIKFYGVVLQPNQNIPFRFADMVEFDYSDDTLNISIYHTEKSLPIKIDHLV